MKKIIPLLCLILSGFCTQSKASGQNDNDDEFWKAFNKFEKVDSKKNADNAIDAYNKLKEVHLKNLKSLLPGKDVSRWDNILAEYISLQDAHDVIAESKLSALLKPQDYKSELQEAIKQAAMENYVTGKSYLKNSGRNYLLKAYEYIKKASLLMPEFKEASIKADSIYDLAAIRVVIDRFDGDSFYLNNRSDTSVAFNNARLVAYMQNMGNKRIAVKFYTQEVAQKLHVTPDLVIDVNLINMTPSPAPVVNNDSKGGIGSVFVGIDSLGKEIRQTVSGALNTKTSVYNASAQISISITDINSQGAAVPVKLNSTYSWQNETSSYTGDFRALSEYNASLVNRFPVPPPTMDNIISGLFRKLYPQLIDHINTSLYWTARSLSML